MTGPRPSGFPDSLVLIFGLILLAQLGTYVLPAGEFERQGRQVVRGFMFHYLWSDSPRRMGTWHA